MMREIVHKRDAVLALIRWDKPYGTLLLLAPALWSLFIAAQGAPPVHLILIFVCGSFLMRSAGCAINDFADLPFDVHVERTCDRPLPSGKLTPFQAFVVFAFFSLAAFSLIWLLNPLTRVLSVVAMVLAVTYPFTKRFIKFPQLFMGIAFGWGSVMAWTAVRNRIEIETVWVFLATLCWATAYDTIYALMDREEDARIGVHSSALWFGKRIWQSVSVLFGLSLFFLFLTGVLSGLGIFYYIALGIVACLFIRQIVYLKFDPSDKKMLFSLFKSNAAIGFLLLAGIMAGRFL